MSQPLTLQDLRSNGSSLTATLNILLANLHLPFVLETPADLTPSLLLGILECILESRLPIPINIRESRSESAKVEAMKTFLGVLESDILQMDVGLSDVDPRKLAASEWDEVVFVGELLCWLGKQSGIIAVDTPGDNQKYLEKDDEENEEELEDVFGKTRDNTASSGHSQNYARVASPSTRSTLTDSAHTALFMANGVTENSDTTAMSMPHPVSPPSTPQRQRRTHDYLESPAVIQRRTPLCIHELEDDTFIRRALGDSAVDKTIELESQADSSMSDCDCLTEMSENPPVSIRYTGWLERVDANVEIESFEARRRERLSNNIRSKAQSYVGLGRTPGRDFSTPTSSNPFPRSFNSRSSQGVITRHTSPTEHTLALMNERARLLAELASINTPRAAKNR